MIYVSSTCVKHEKIKDSVEELAKNGFKNIELSGGTKYYKGYEEDLLGLRDQYRLNYFLHSYFPPPKQNFILNLASLNVKIYQKTLKHYETAISLSRKLGSSKFGLHAGFFVDFTAKEIGENISLTELYDKDKTIKKFCDGYNRLKKAAGDIELYIENNVLSHSNARTFKGQNPFMLTNYNEYLELRNLIDFKLLLDVGHLKVSANSLGLNFAEQLHKAISIADYVHLSDNDGLYDQQCRFSEKSSIFNMLKDYDFHGKTITVETRGGIFDIKLALSVIKTLRLGQSDF